MHFHFQRKCNGTVFMVSKKMYESQARSYYQYEHNIQLEKNAEEWYLLLIEEQSGALSMVRKASVLIFKPRLR